MICSPLNCFESSDVLSQDIEDGEPVSLNDDSNNTKCTDLSEAGVPSHLFVFTAAKAGMDNVDKEKTNKVCFLK